MNSYLGSTMEANTLKADNTKWNTQRITRLALFVALALILHAVESMIPAPLPVPGARLGLANIVTLIVIVLTGAGDALLVVGLRTFLASLLSGRLTSFAFSIVGGVLATLAMSLAYRRLRHVLGLAGISILGAVAHNIGQLLVAWAVLGTPAIFSYLPALLLTGVATGFFVGLTAGYSLQYLLPGDSFTCSRPERSTRDGLTDELEAVYDEPERTS
jgi:heptaprenyl diphosphate synthase